MAFTVFLDWVSLAPLVCLDKLLCVRAAQEVSEKWKHHTLLLVLPMQQLHCVAGGRSVRCRCVSIALVV